MGTEWTIVIATGGFFFSILVAAVSAVMAVNRGTASIYKKLSEIELWNRDNFVKKDEFVLVKLQLVDFVQRLDRAAVKVDTMWSFQIRRAMSEVVDKGLGDMNSPLHFNEMAYKSLEPIKSKLINFYSNLQPMKDSEVLLAIESKFGDELLNLVCIPCGLSHGACLLLAYAVAKQTTDLEIKL